jgi:hypothetical protein
MEFVLIRNRKTVNQLRPSLAGRITEGKALVAAGYMAAMAKSAILGGRPDVMLGVLVAAGRAVLVCVVARPGVVGGGRQHGNQGDDHDQGDKYNFLQHGFSPFVCANYGQTSMPSN